MSSCFSLLSVSIHFILKVCPPLVTTTPPHHHTNHHIISRIDPITLLTLCIALIKRHRGEISESLGLFQACSLLNPGNFHSLKQIARSLYLLGKHKESLGILEVLQSPYPCENNLTQSAECGKDGTGGLGGVAQQRALLNVYQGVRKGGWELTQGQFILKAWYYLPPSCKALCAPGELQASNWCTPGGSSMLPSLFLSLT